MAAFVNKKVQLEELDLIWNKIPYKFIELIFMSEEERRKPENIAFQEVQATLDDLKILQIKDYTTTLVTFSKGKYIAFPTNYYHLINDRTLVGKVCSGCDGNVQQTQEATNRLTRTEVLPNKLDNTMAKTREDSPISEESGNRLYVYNLYKGNSQFNINEIYIDYLKKPTVVAYNDVTFPNGTTVIEFPDQTCYKFIDMCIIYISKITQQNQQKITNLMQQSSIQ